MTHLLAFRRIKSAAVLAVALWGFGIPGAQAQQTVPAHAPAPAAAAPAWRTEVRNPLPLGTNAENRPLAPGTAPRDMALRPYVEGHPLVFLAISGGGSRSAYYAASVMEQLARVPLPGVANQALPDGRPLYSLLDSVRCISTVSAGGLASSWYVSHFDQRKTPDFFDRMKKAMGVNLQWRTYGHMVLFPPLAVQLLASSVTRTDMLSAEIDKLIGGRKLTFNDLRAMEERAIDPSPILMINGTVYNSGQRLVMTNLPAMRLPALLGKPSSNIAMPDTDRQILRNLVQPLTFADFGSDIGSYPLSKALAASAAYPILLAPVPLKIFPANVPPHVVGRVDEKLLQSPVAYVADGGLYENEGVDPLLSLIKTVDAEQPVLLIIIDGSERMETMRLPEGKVFGPTTVISRMYDIGTLKPLAYYSSMIDDHHNPDKLELVFVRMEGYDAKTQETLKNIPTQFALSPSHRSALEGVAEQNFSRMRDPLLSAFDRLTVKRSPGKKAVSRRSRTAAQK